MIENFYEDISYLMWDFVYDRDLRTYLDILQTD